MKQCSNCGNWCDDQAQFCNHCGSPLGQQGNANQGNMNQDNGNWNQWGATGNSAGIFVRSIPLAIVLTIITCGIYELYWIVKVNDEVNQLAGDTQATTGGMVLLFTIITCGIYGLYWYYKMGEKVDYLNNIRGGNAGILYLILSIFGLGIVNMCLIQDTINKRVRLG